MANHKSTLTMGKEERKIPVFTVLKNNVILKNIYLINTPPSPVSDEDKSGGSRTLHHHNQEKDLEDTLLVGRHLDCDIRLEHPSISRFHLRIHFKPYSNYFTVTDLSSVHGTWVSGRRIESRLRMEMKEGDTLRIGGSSRIYRLHWIPLAHAYDFENRFVPPMDLRDQEDEEEEISKNEEVKEMENENMESVGRVVETSEHPFQRESPEVPNVISLSLSEPEEDIETSLSGKENGELEGKPECAISVDSAQMESSFFGISECFLQNDTKNVILNEDEGGEGENSQENEDGKLVDSVLFGLESLFLDESSGCLAREDSAPPANPEEDVAPDYGVIQYMDSALGTIPELSDMGFKCYVGKERPAEDEEIYEEEQVIDEETHSASPFVEVEDPIPAGIGTEGNHQFIKPLISDAEVVEALASQHQLREDQESERPETGERNLQNTEETYKQQPVFEASSGVEIKEKSITGSCSSTDLAENAVDSSTYDGEGVSAIADVLLEDENQSTAYGPIDPWSFWSASLSAASLKLSPPISGILLAADQYRIQRGSHDTLNGTVNNEVKCTYSLGTTLNNNSMERGYEQKEIWSFWSRTLGSESMCFSLPDGEVLLELDNEQMNSKSKCSVAVEKAGKTPVLESLPVSSPNRSNSCSIWSRRGNHDSAIQIQTSSSRQSVRQNTSEGKAKYEAISKGLFSGSGDHEELFTPDKETYTPNTEVTIRKLSLLKEVPQSNSAKSYPRDSSCSIDISLGNGMSASSDKENQTPECLKGLRSASCTSGIHGKRVAKSNVRERLPFQCLLANSPQESPSQTLTFSSAMRNRNSAYIVGAQSSKDCSGKGTKKWNMVVDTTCFLNKGSRKALQLLEGLKGTRLVMPRIVLRELDCMNWKSTFFQRKTEVSAVLAWIEECMEKRKWWIHIQSSVEEGRSGAPTPPATPQSVLSGGMNGSTSGILLEMVSPTAEDHVLNFALFFRRFKNDGHLVLLTDDIGLKIKAMAEGLICETAEEFRESLVNPFSERFLWADSSPRGQTWSFLDDLALRHNFYPCSLDLACKVEDMKGLKLILINSSQLGHLSSMC